VLYGGGLRRGEAISLQLADYRPDDAPELIVRGGKGRKDRALDLAPKFKRRLDAWVRLRGAQPGRLFCPIGNGGYPYVGKLHPQTITDLMRAIAVACGLPHFTPHDLRRSFATHLLDALYDERGVLVRPGFPITVVAELMGHASVKTTMAYYRGNDEKRRRASYSLPGGGQ
jgi:integrase